MITGLGRAPLNSSWGAKRRINRTSLTVRWAAYPTNRPAMWDDWLWSAGPAIASHTLELSDRVGGGSVSISPDRGL